MTTAVRSRYFVLRSTDLNSRPRALPTCGISGPGPSTLCSGSTSITVTETFNMCHRRSAMPVRITRFLPRVIRSTPTPENSMRHVGQATPETRSMSQLRSSARNATQWSNCIWLNTIPVRVKIIVAPCMQPMAEWGAALNAV